MARIELALSCLPSKGFATKLHRHFLILVGSSHRRQLRVGKYLPKIEAVATCYCSLLLMSAKSGLTLFWGVVEIMERVTRFELVTSDLEGRRSDQLS